MVELFVLKFSSPNISGVLVSLIFLGLLLAPIFPNRFLQTESLSLIVAVPVQLGEYCPCNDNKLIVGSVVLLLTRLRPHTVGKWWDYFLCLVEGLSSDIVQLGLAD